MDEISIKDLIFSFRHMYLENLKKLNKRLKKHLSITSSLVDDFTLYARLYKFGDSNINVKYKFDKDSIGSLAYKFSEAFSTCSFLRETAKIKKNEEGHYDIDNRYGLKIKDHKIDKEMECILKEDFYKNMPSLNKNGNISITFSGYEICITTKDFMVCYNSVGDVIYTYTPEEISINDILNSKIDVSLLDDYHKNLIKKSNKVIDDIQDEKKDSSAGDYLIKENDKTYTLKRIKKDRLHRYI